MMSSEQRRIDAFFYGLFMDEETLRAKGLNPLNRRTASLQNFALVIGERATLVPREGEKVYGIIFSLTHDEVSALYAESSVSMYRPEAVLAELEDGTLTPALCFNLPTPPSKDERNPRYASRLRELAGRIGLPESYVSAIE
jgi:hypothetical protein